MADQVVLSGTELRTESGAGIPLLALSDVNASGDVNITGNLELDGAFNHDGTTFGALGVTPAAQATAYTQTYSTAARTVPDATYAAPATTATVHTYPASGNLFDAVGNDLLINVRTDSTANAVADSVVNFKSLADNVNQAIVDRAATTTQLVALAADVLALKKVITALIDDSQAFGFSA